MSPVGETSPPAPLPGGEGGDAVSFAPLLGPGDGRFGRGPGMTDRARALRSSMTDAERRLWAVLRGDRMGVRFRRQLVIDRRFIADFCAPEIALIVEVDGGQHAENPDDLLRTRYLERRGYKVLRFWNTDVLLATDSVAETIWTTVQGALAVSSPVQKRTSGIAGRASPPSPLWRGDGGEVLSARAAPDRKIAT